LLYHELRALSDDPDEIQEEIKATEAKARHCQFAGM
jgi:uncharacterized protein (DUF169 family)